MLQQGEGCRGLGLNPSLDTGPALRPTRWGSVASGQAASLTSEDLRFLNTYTVVAISIRSSNFGWARPHRVVSQAVFKKNASGRPKFGSEREVRSSPWGFSALTASRLDAPRVLKNPKGKRFSWPHRRPLTLATHTAMSDPGGPAGPAVPPPAPAATVWPQGADPSKAGGGGAGAGMGSVQVL